MAVAGVGLKSPRSWAMSLPWPLRVSLFLLAAPWVVLAQVAPLTQDNLVGAYEAKGKPATELLKLDSGRSAMMRVTRRHFLELKPDYSMIWIQTNDVTSPLVKTGAWVFQRGKLIVYWLSTRGDQGRAHVLAVEPIEGGFRFKLERETFEYLRSSEPLPENLYETGLVLSSLERLQILAGQMTREVKFVGAATREALEAEYRSAYLRNDIARLMALTYPAWKGKDPNYLDALYEHHMTSLLFPGEVVGFDTLTPEQKVEKTALFARLGSGFPKSFVWDGGISPKKQSPGQKGVGFPGGNYYGTTPDGRWALLPRAFLKEELRELEKP